MKINQIQKYYNILLSILYVYNTHNIDDDNNNKSNYSVKKVWFYL